MKRALTTVGTIALALVVIWGVLAPAPSAEDRVQALGDRIRCPVCNGESIADSPAQTARQMLAIVEEQVADGASDTDIISYFTDRYGQAILLDPPFGGVTATLWLIPAVALAAGVWVVTRRVGGSSGAPTVEVGSQRAGEPDAAGSASAPDHEPEESPSSTPPRTGRVFRTAAAVAFAVIAVGTLAAFALQPRASGPVSGATVDEQFDLDSVSNEQMEAVIAANLDNPQIAGMRMALADRYFSTRDFRSALPHYLRVLEGEATSRQASVALARLGWMTWESAGAEELTTAQAYLDSSLGADPNNVEAQLFKGLVTLYGAEQCAAALPFLVGVAADAAITGQARQLVETAIGDAESGLGGRCS